MSNTTTAEFEVEITDKLIDAFAELSGDRNKLHMSLEYARNLKFQNRIAHGVLLSSFVSRLVGEHLPGGDVLLLSLKMDFHKPVHPGDFLKVKGIIQNESPATRTLDIRFDISRNNVSVSKGSVLVQRQMTQ
jgi:acyl dehydratase